jgi:glutamate dehydrogenase
MEPFPGSSLFSSKGAEPLGKAESVGLDLRVLYEAVIDLFSEGLLTANSLNLAAGILLFDSQGLDKEALMQRAFMRHSRPPVNSLGFPEEKLSSQGFRVPLEAGNVSLTDGTIVRDGALFHRNFLVNPENRQYIIQSNIRAFIPCGGIKDTIHYDNVRQFLDLFQELRFIVEGANVFFDDCPRRHITTQSPVKQIKDSTANKGGVFSSSIAEVLTALPLQEDYEEKIQNNPATHWAPITISLEIFSDQEG